MLAPSRNHRTEAKYNVTTEFPYLGLHSASASGDIGLVQYALSHGQPVNSVLDGVLPLHAACAGGNDLVVKLLIKHGADVNAPRLPRRYSDRNRDVSAPIVGTSGSTPLHFASANGHLTVVRTLLAHGAIPSRADKHGITAEHIARENGWIECAELLAKSVADMREKQSSTRSDNKPGNDTAGRSALCPTDHAESPLRRRLNFKYSIDHALNALKSGCSTPDVEPKSASLHPDSLEQSQPRESTPGAHPTALVPPGRHPSLPQADDGRTHGVLSRSRRPRSAGTGAETTSRKLNSKLSLLSLFRKSNDDGSSSSVTPIPEHNGCFPLSSSPMPPDPSPPSSVVGSPPTYSTSLSSSPREVSHDECQRWSDSAASPSGGGNCAPHPTELQNAFAENHSHCRSTSGTSAVSGFNEGKSTDNVPSGVPLRHGILRMRNQSSSPEHSASEQSVSSPRILRFQSSTSSIKSIGRWRNPSGRSGQSPHYSNPSGGQCEEDYDSIPNTIEESPVVPPQPTPPIFVNFLDEDDLDEEYGVPLNGAALPTGSIDSVGPSLAVSPLPFSINTPPPTEELPSTTAEGRLRGDSISSAGTTGTTSTYPPSSSSDAVWSLGTPGTPHLSPHPVIVPTPGEMSSDKDLVHETGESHRAKPLLLDKVFSSISSYAQAEELVQLTQQSILNMEPHLEENTMKDAETGRTPLSAKLAAYGESLAIERRLKETRTPDLPDVMEIKRVYHRGRSSLSTRSADAFMNEDTSAKEHEVHGGRTASVSGRNTHPKLGDTQRFLYTPPRSRTPKLGVDPGFNDGPSFSISAAHSTRFPRDRSRDADPTRSARKLSRMGFSTVDSWQPSPFKGEVSRSPPPKHFFGGIRTLMQSLQGK
ncbi:hypothetical protein EDC04DRAFT_326731 [Pisolithus marmoratus]|nr:hypothetical protein EDC04DRAFT_326731 [Pisolithus marmoratus]